MLSKLEAFEEDAQYPDARFPMKHLLARGGMEHNNPAYIHWHEAMEILHVYRGVLFARVGSGSSFLQPGDTLLIGSGLPHIITFPQPGPVVYSVYLFHPQLISTAWGDAYETEYLLPTLAKEQFVKAHVGLVSRGAHPYGAAHYLGQLRSELTQAQPGYRLRARGCLLLSLGYLYQAYQSEMSDRCPQPSAVDQETGPHSEMDRFRPAFEYVKARFSEPLTLEDVARSVSMSKYHFSREFRRITGYSFSQYLRDVRLNHAIHLLRTTDRTVTQIALESGFRSVPAFYDMFKQALDCTPGVIRRQQE